MAWKPSKDVLECALDAYERAPGVRQEPAMRNALLVAVKKDPLLNTAEELRDALQLMRDSFMSMTHWSGEPPECVAKADAALAKARSRHAGAKVPA